MSVAESRSSWGQAAYPQKNLFVGTDGGGNYLQFGPLLGSGAVEGLYAYLRTGFIVSLKKQPTEPVVIVMVSCWILASFSVVYTD